VLISLPSRKRTPKNSHLRNRNRTSDWWDLFLTWPLPSQSYPRNDHKRIRLLPITLDVGT
jgi:hypothetical protein